MKFSWPPTKEEVIEHYLSIKTYVENLEFFKARVLYISMREYIEEQDNMFRNLTYGTNEFIELREYLFYLHKILKTLGETILNHIYEQEREEI